MENMRISNLQRIIIIIICTCLLNLTISKERTLERNPQWGMKNYTYEQYLSQVNLLQSLLFSFHTIFTTFITA